MWWKEVRGARRCRAALQRYVFVILAACPLWQNKIPIYWPLYTKHSVKEFSGNSNGIVVSSSNKYGFYIIDDVCRTSHIVLIKKVKGCTFMIFDVLRRRSKTKTRCLRRLFESLFSSFESQITRFGSYLSWADFDGIDWLDLGHFLTVIDESVSLIDSWASAGLSKRVIHSSTNPKRVFLASFQLESEFLLT